MVFEMMLHGIGEVIITGILGRLAAMAGSRQQGILHRIRVAKSIWRGAPVANVQQRMRTNAQLGEAEQCTRLAGQCKFCGQQHRRTFDRVVDRIAKQRHGAERHHRRAEQDEILSDGKRRILAGAARRDQLDGDAARILDGIRLDLAARIGKPYPAIKTACLRKQADFQLSGQIRFDAKTSTQQSDRFRMRVAARVVSGIVARHLAAQDVGHLGDHRRFARLTCFQSVESIQARSSGQGSITPA